MKYNFLYDKKNSQVACYSEGKIGYDRSIFNEIEIKPTAEEQRKLKQSYVSLFIKDEKLFFEERESSQIDLLQQEIKNLKIKVNNLMARVK